MRRIYKKFIRTLLMLLVISAVFPFVYPWKDGKPLLSWSQLKLPSLPDLSLPEFMPSADQSGQTVTVYKWRDAQGNWQFGNEPPKERTFETLMLDPDTNLVEGVKAPSATPTSTTPDKQAPAQATNDELVFGYTPEKIEAMMEKTRQVRDSMNAHHQRLEGLDQ